VADGPAPSSDGTEQFAPACAMTRYITVWLPPERPCCASHAYVLPEQRHHDENGKDLEALEYTGVRHVIARAGLANLSDKMGYQCASSDRHMHLPMLDGKTSEAESVRRDLIAIQGQGWPS
jgi:hypothetical protein